MAKQTLSVDLDSALVDRVRRYSEARGKDVAQTVSELIERLPLNGTPGNHDQPEEPWEAELSPAVRSILGVGSGPADEHDYHDYLMEKYGR
jgi:hypothetical protein